MLSGYAKDAARILLATSLSAVVGISGLASAARATAPLYDPVVLNIGISCQWQQSCQRRQLKAMLAANRFIARENPPLWRIHLCNRNARRAAARADWVGFNACIRNARLQPPQQQGRRRR